ncbi:hypothetical protein DFJ67_0636 [Asanoa ferruginea]|uniref:Uncharacterized protein n=1 Tax=Asanoa ferruginea TaxID=53367 RepID=A0A3D9ZBM8_9ACTN|nr:hypothetical protein [Asanoa ferruginea]REF94695.1 hypothetical protein DFJ67_0636 [Asanoa ferruginea]GIF45727.1 hypothetical protein Afe04nite_02660 [Asanoa ferruginea]
MTMTVVEIHVPLTPVPGLGENDYAFPWIDDVEDFLAGLEEAEEFDSGEEYGDVYVFFIAGAPDEVLLSVAARVAGLERVPAGAFAVISDDEAEEFGRGRRVSLP